MTPDAAGRDPSSFAGPAEPGPRGRDGGGARRTTQRAAVLAALHDADGFRTAQELHDVLRAAGERVGLTTVYRSLQLLSDTGEVDVLLNDAGEAMYRRCERRGHHHHLVCRSCKKSVEIESGEVERWTERAAGEYGFSAVTHTMEVFGLCTTCSPA